MFIEGPLSKKIHDHLKSLRVNNIKPHYRIDTRFQQRQCDTQTQTCAYTHMPKLNVTFRVTLYCESEWRVLLNFSEFSLLATDRHHHSDRREQLGRALTRLKALTGGVCESISTRQKNYTFKSQSSSKLT